jgi:uncharacterized membrane protein YfcA
MTEISLLFIAFITSSIAGALGMGGGILLIACMPGLLPVQAILPLHAVTQLASNGSRLAIGWRAIDWQLVPALLVGAVVGAVFGGAMYRELDLRWLPGLIGILILVITWVRLPSFSRGGYWALALLGFYQTSLGMLVGATGPLGAAVLRHFGQGRDWLVVNTAVYMSINHGLRVAAFALLGFGFAPWLGLLLGMVIASVVGSWCGTKIRHRIPQQKFQLVFKLLVTLLAVRMIVLAVTAGYS